MPGICHAMGGEAVAGIDFASPGIAARLVNKTSTSASCSPVTTPYLVPNSNPAQGLLLQKLMDPPPCGLIMPFGGGGGPVTTEDSACLNDWATAVAAGRINP